LGEAITAVIQGSSTRVGWTLAALIAAITYGSCFPFDFKSLAAAGHGFASLTHEGLLGTSRGDNAGNVALFAPLGWASGWMLMVQQRPRAAWVATWVAALALATLLQVAQVFLPSRDPALADVVWNGLGQSLGMVAGAWGGAHARRATSLAPAQRARPWPIAFALGLLFIDLAPWLPTLDAQHVKNAIKALWVVPWSPLATVHTMAYHLAAVALLTVGWTRMRHAHALWATGVCAAPIALRLVLAGKLIKSSVVAGSGLALATAVLVGRRGTRALAWAAWVVLVLSMVLDGLAPYQWRGDWQAMNWVPFRPMLQGVMLFNALSLLNGLLAMGAWLCLCDALGWQRAWSAAALLGLVAALESAQMGLVHRVPDITPVLLAAVMAWLLPVQPPEAAHDGTSVER
jgi:VanZ family protein